MLRRLALWWHLRGLDYSFASQAKYERLTGLDKGALDWCNACLDSLTFDDEDEGHDYNPDTSCEDLPCLPPTLA